MIDSSRAGQVEIRERGLALHHSTWGKQTDRRGESRDRTGLCAYPARREFNSPSAPIFRFCGSPIRFWHKDYGNGVSSSPRSTSYSSQQTLIRVFVVMDADRTREIPLVASLPYPFRYRFQPRTELVYSRLSTWTPRNVPSIKLFAWAAGHLITFFSFNQHLNSQSNRTSGISTVYLQYHQYVQATAFSATLDASPRPCVDN